MKKTSLSLTKIASVVGLFLGMFTLSVMAVNWTAAPYQAPEGNTDAPINVGTFDQNKVGRLGVATTTSPLVAFEAGGAGVFAGDLAVAGKVITNGLMLKGTNSDKKGYVLTNDGNGNAGWQASTGGLDGNSPIVRLNVPVNETVDIPANRCANAIRIDMTMDALRNDSGAGVAAWLYYNFFVNGTEDFILSQNSGNRKSALAFGSYKGGDSGHYWGYRINGISRTVYITDVSRPYSLYANLSGDTGYFDVYNSIFSVTCM